MKEIIAESLIEKLNSMKETNGRAPSFRKVLTVIREQPPARGEKEWLETKIGTLPARRCSGCANTIPIILNDDGSEVLNWEYCSKCGSRMLLKKEEAEPKGRTMVTTKEYAEKWGVSPSMAVFYCRVGQLKSATKIGAQWYIDIDETPQYVRKPKKFGK